MQFYRGEYQGNNQDNGSHNSERRHTYHERPRSDTESGCPKLVCPSHGTVEIRIHGGISVAEYACKDGYQLVGDKQRSCLPSDWCWSGRGPKCEAKGIYIHLIHLAVTIFLRYVQQAGTWRSFRCRCVYI